MYGISDIEIDCRVSRSAAPQHLFLQHVSPSPRFPPIFQDPIRKKMLVSINILCRRKQRVKAFLCLVIRKVIQDEVG